jgi:hypothetical protein
MNWVQAHLVLNHLPVVGTWIGAGLLAWGLLTRKEDVRRAALGLLAMVALSAVPAFFSGIGAEERVAELPGISSAEISDHEAAAVVALAGCMLLGVVAVAALLVSRRRQAVPAGWLATVLCLALLCSAILAQAAHLGGMIRHPEIRGGPAQSLG